MIIIFMNKTWKRETPLQNVAFIAMMGAINGAFSVMLSFLPLSSFMALLILPCVNALGIYVIKARWIPIYVFATLGVPLVATCYDISTTLFYILPSIASGLIYGALTKFKTPVPLTIFICSLWTLGSTYLMIPLVKLIYEIDMIPTTLTTLGKEDSSLAKALVPSILFAYSWAAISINHLVMTFIHEKLGFEAKTYDAEKYLYPILTFIFSVLSIVFAFKNVTLAYLFFSLSLFFTIFSVATLLNKIKFYYYIILVVLLVIAFFLFAVFAKRFEANTVISLGTIFFDAIALSTLISLISKKQSC